MTDLVTIIPDERLAESQPAPASTVQPHRFEADPRTFKCVTCGMGRTRHYEALAAAKENGK